MPLPAACVRQVGLSVAALLAATVQRALEQLDAPSKLQRAEAGCAQPRLTNSGGDDQRVASRSDPDTAMRPPRSPNLALIPESQIDTVIETARIVQLIESGCEAELVDLAGLCSGLLRRPAVDASVVPLQPSACAVALREGINRVTQDAALRPALLRVLG